MRNPQQAAQVTRICRKLETAWLARPDDGFGAFSWTIGALIGAHPDMLAVLTDDELEQRLDAYLAKRGLPNEWILPAQSGLPVCALCRQGIDSPSIYHSHKKDVETVSDYLERIVKLPEAEWILEAGRHAPGCAWVKHRGQLIACA